MTWYEIRCPQNQGGCNRRQPQDLQDGGHSRGPCRRCGRMLEASVHDGQVIVILAGDKPKQPKARWTRYFEEEQKHRLHQH